MLVHLNEQWRPDSVDLSDYAEDCEYWRQGVSLHVLRQNISDSQKQRVAQPEFGGESDLAEFKQRNAQTTLRCQSSTSSSEVTEQLLRDCVISDPAIASVDYLIYCHSSIDLEFYSTPACRAQNALQNQKIIPFSLSQCGTAAGLAGLEIGHTLGLGSKKGVVIALNDLGIMPARRRILSDVLVNDGASILHLTPEGAGSRISACEITQYSISASQSTDLLPAFVDLLEQAQSSVGSIEGVMTILPTYSTQFQKSAVETLPKGPSYVFENSDGGYSGVNFAYNSLLLFAQSRQDTAIILQVSETGAGVFCIVSREA